MSPREKYMLLHYIMIDIRINSKNATKRMKYAIKLAKELSLESIANRLEATLNFTYANLLNGRALNIPYQYGGYKGLESFHGFPASLLKRSKEFKKAALKNMHSPEKLFADLVVVPVGLIKAKEEKKWSE